MTRILLVDADDREAHELGRTLEQRTDCKVVRASSLLEAIRAAGESTFDAAVLDTDLPDGSGLDILDFLRIGSPGIRIVLLSQQASEQVAFHALSHGAGDFIVKGKHLEQELARRLDALLEHDGPMGALVDTLAPVLQYDKADLEMITLARQENALQTTLDELVEGSVHAAGVWDLRGHPLAVSAPDDMDEEGIGFAMATLHGQVGALWTYGELKPSGYRLLIDVEGGLLAVTAIPGTYIVALLFDGGFAPRRALDRIDQASVRILAALQAGASGGDVPDS